MPHPNQAPLDWRGMTPREYAQQRPGEDPPVQPPPSPPPRRAPDTRSFGQRYGDAATAGVAGAVPAALAAGGIAAYAGTPLAAAPAAGLMLGAGALGGVVEQGVRDIAPEWAEDNPWLAPGLSILATGGIGGAARAPAYIAQHGPGLARAAMAAAALHWAGAVDLARHAVTFGTGLAGTIAAKGFAHMVRDPLGRGVLGSAAAGSIGNWAYNQLTQPAPPAAEADIPLRPWEDMLPANRRTRLQADPGAAGQ